MVIGSVPLLKFVRQSNTLIPQYFQNKFPYNFLYTLYLNSQRNPILYYNHINITQKKKQQNNAQKILQELMYIQKKSQFSPNMLKSRYRDKGENGYPIYHANFIRSDESEMLITGVETDVYSKESEESSGKQQSQCQERQNGLLDGYLFDLKYEIQLKSKALTTAEIYIKALQQQIANLQKQSKQLVNNLLLMNKKNQQLQIQLNAFKNLKGDQILKKSILKTKNFIGEKKWQGDIGGGQLKLISCEMFNQFIGNFQALVNELSQWQNRLKQDEMSNSICNRLQVHSVQVQSLLQGKSDDLSSKTTSQSLSLQQNNKQKSLLSQTISDQYEQTIQKYRQLCTKLQIQFSKSLTYIQEMNISIQQNIKQYNKIIQPDSIIIKNIIRIIIKQCNNIKIFVQELNVENLQLNYIVKELILWINQNTIDKPLFFKKYVNIS